MQQSMTENVVLESRIKDSAAQYGIYTNFSRAIPDVRDGLKPVHRRIIFGMSENKMSHLHSNSKSAEAVGYVMGRYHPHGDSSIYDAMVKMAQKWETMSLLIDGQGNWGSKTDDPAAYRYTECRLAKNASHLMGWHPGATASNSEINEEVVNMVDNYDGKRKEPEVLPALYPNFVVNGTHGIGFGIATQSPSHNLRESLNLAHYMVDTPNPGIEKVMQILPGPEIPDACDIYDTGNPDHGIASYLQTGHGSFFVRGRMHVEEYEMGTKRKPQTGYYIIIDGLPPKTSAEKVMNGITYMIENQELPLGVSVANESHSGNARIVVDVSNNSADDVQARLLLNRNTGLQYSEAVFSAVFDGESIRYVGTIEAIALWLEHRRKCIVRRSTFRRRRAKERLHSVEGFIKAVPLAEEIVRLVKASDSKSEANEEMQSRWGFSQIQAAAVLDMTIGQITKLGVDRYLDERNELTASVEENTKIIDDPSYLNKVLKLEIKAVSKEVGRDRVSHIMEGTAYIERPSTPAVEEPTINGYLVKTGKGYLRWVQSNRFNRQLSDDYVTETVSVTNKNMVEMISSEGYHSRMDMDYIPNKITSGKMIFSGYLDAGESIVEATSTAEVGGLDSDLYVITNDGLGKRLSSAVWAHAGKKAYNVINASADGQTVAGAFFAVPEKDVLIISKYGRALKIDSDNLTHKGRSAQAQPYINLTTNGDGELQEGEGVAYYGAVDNDDVVVYWTNDGRVGQFNVADVRRMGRGKSGSWMIDSDATFYVIGARVIKSSDTQIKWFHGTFNEPRSIDIADIPQGTSLDKELVDAPGLTDAVAIWTE